MPKSKGTRKHGQVAKSRPKNKRLSQPMKSSEESEAGSINQKLPNAFNLMKDSLLVIWRERKVFSVIIFIYGLVYLVLVMGLSTQANVSSLKSQFSGAFHGHLGSLYSGFGIFTYLIGKSTSSSTPAGSAYQVIIITIASLSIIWTLRQHYLGAEIRARDSYYRGMYPLTQYILVLLFIAIELIPLVIGLSLYNLLINGGIAVTFIEQALSILLVLLLVVFSFYLISSSVIALYIATLPDMTPLKALRSAKQLVKGRHWNVFRKILFLPFALVVLAAIIMIPFILVLPQVASWLFFILVLIGLACSHSYLYSLYRGLINEQV